MSSTGPSIRAVVRVINQNSCGSGSICGLWNGGSLILTNAHVAGTRIGRQVQVEIESLGMKRMTAEVIRAAYSNQVSADWALLHLPGFQEIEPVYLTKIAPKQGESMYTKGFPRCNQHNGTDISQVAVLSNGVLLWLPDAIGGQSGSGVWGDKDGLCKGLLTWSMQRNGRWYGAGQLTSEIYRQNRGIQRGEALSGFAKMPDLRERPFDLGAVDRDGCDDPVVEEGAFSAPITRGIQDFPIWIEDLDEPEDPEDPPVEPGPGDDAWRVKARASLMKVRDAAEDELKKFDQHDCPPIDPGDDKVIDDTFGL